MKLSNLVRTKTNSEMERKLEEVKKQTETTVKPICLKLKKLLESNLCQSDHGLARLPNLTATTMSLTNHLRQLTLLSMFMDTEALIADRMCISTVKVKPAT